MSTMSYKGYTARVEYDERDNIFVGRILGIRSIISFGDRFQPFRQPLKGSGRAATPVPGLERSRLEAIVPGEGLLCGISRVPDRANAPILECKSTP
jgi:hypothetical protein